MSIFKGSRYEYSTIDYVSTKNKAAAYPIVFYEFSPLSTITFSYHAYVEGERLDQIAETYYKNSLFWWVIPEYNPEILDFTNLAPGTLLRIPNV
jgi:hypothetical protein